jgi:ATP-dependent DNA helicase DinG
VSAPLPYPALHASHAGIWIATANGETRRVSRGDAIALAAETPVIMLNAPLVAARLGCGDLSGLDLLELFAFVHPARFMVPTVKGLIRALALSPLPFRGGAGVGNTQFLEKPDHPTPSPSPEGEGLIEAAVPALLQQAAQVLLETAQGEWPEREGAWTCAQALARLRWPWAPALADRLTAPGRDERWLFSKLPEWEEAAPRPAPRPVELTQEEVIARLGALTGEGAERREGQRAYASAAMSAFAPRLAVDMPRLLLAEAGTGIGKTLGYLAPASLWAEKSGGPVWISTYTKALQRQLTTETARIYGTDAAAKGRVVIRKGRENYLCLLNLEDALQGGFAGRAAIMAQLVARWAAYSRDGDMVGGDLPGWLPTLFRRNGSTALTDRRGECVYAGCPHYPKCFIERATRASAEADIVVANHALVMVNAARGREEATRPTRYVFDEGHHVFDAADTMFAAALTGQEAIELRRWIIGPEGKSRGRRRGLAARLADVASYDADGATAIGAAAHAASALPSDGWVQRVAEGAPFGPMEALFAEIRGLVFARATDEDAGYGLETEAAQLDGALLTAVEPACKALDALLRPLIALGRRLESVLEEAPDWLDGQARARIEGARSSLSWRTDTLAAWLSMLARLGGPTDPDFVDWLAVERIEGRAVDIGLRRHWLDPTRPFAATVLKPAHGALITSATLKGGEEWDVAEARTGVAHTEARPIHFEAASPFDYAAQAQVLIVTDVKRGDVPQLANAYAQLIAAAGGGTLGLFTAIRRLRAVHARIADRLARDGLPLYAQHVDPIDTGTLVDIFRDDPRASLIGTDALRDGVDVPGESLRLVVMEGVPWPKPTVLHAARKAAGGGSAYDDRIIRARLAQAFGRLIRRQNDKGTFVLLSSAVPSRLLSAFPDGTPVRRVTLEEAVTEIAGSHSALPTQRHLSHELDR